MQTWWLPASSSWSMHRPLRVKPVSAIPGWEHFCSSPPRTFSRAVAVFAWKPRNRTAKQESETMRVISMMQYYLFDFCGHRYALLVVFRVNGCSPC